MQRLTRRQFVSASAATLLLSSSLKAAQPARTPNIIYILADDLGWGDLSCFGQTKFTTPNIDRLADEGMKFTQHYSGTTLCAPSRCSLMTGLHTGHTQIRGNEEIEPEGQWPLEKGTVTVASMLKSAGYATGCFGKWGLGYPGSSGAPNKQGFDYFFGYNCQRMAQKYYPKYLWRNDEKVMLPDNDPIKQTGKYSHDLIAEEALKFIRDNKDKPFFAYIPFTIPHAEITVPQDSLDKYKGKFPEEKPYVQKDNKGYPSQKTPFAAFAGMINRMDASVGNILDLLKELKIDDNTIVMFSSDNGPHVQAGADPSYFRSAGPFRGYKRDLYEGGIRAPFIVRWPGRVTPLTISNHISAFWDVMPTLAEIANVKELSKTDGISFLPSLLNKPKDQKKHEYLYWEFHDQGGKQAVRLSQFKGVRLKAIKNPDGPIELYDISIDVEEKNNIADKRPDIVEKIKLIMKQAHSPNKNFPFFETEKI